MAFTTKSNGLHNGYSVMTEVVTVAGSGGTGTSSAFQLPKGTDFSVLATAATITSLDLDCELQLSHDGVTFGSVADIFETLGSGGTKTGFVDVSTTGEAPWMKIHFSRDGGTAGGDVTVSIIS